MILYLKNEILNRCKSVPNNDLCMDRKRYRQKPDLQCSLCVINTFLYGDKQVRYSDRLSVSILSLYSIRLFMYPTLKRVHL